MSKIQDLYNALKSAGADVGTEKEFADWFQAPGQDGYNNRKHLYDTFKSAGADVGDNYEEFASWLNLQPKATQTVDNASKAAPTAKPTQTSQAAQQPSTDVATTTPKSRLEVSTEDDRPSQSYEKTTDPVLRSTTEVNPEAVKEWEGYKETNPLQAQYIEKSIGADRKLPTFEQYAKADAEAQRKDPIGYAFNKSINEMGSADRAHAYLADQKAEIEKQLNDIAKKRMQDYADSNGAALGMTVQEYLNLDEDYKNLSTALEQAKKSEQVSDNARDARTGDSGFWRGIADGLTDANAWTMGALDIQGLMPMMRLKRKLDNGEQLTDTEQALAQQMATNTAISEEYADKQGSWYNIGNIASQSLPFMLQFAMTGGGFGTLTRVGTKLGADAARKFTQNALLRNIIKYTGTAVGDIAGAAVMANTVGAANTVNDIFDRYRGTLIQTGDGQYQFAGGKGLGQSIYEGATAQTIEFYTEKLGAHLAITKQASKALGKMGLSKLSTAMSKLGGNKTLSVLGMQDYPSEVLEEEANIILNASFVGDNKFKDLWDSKQQTDLALGMLFSVGGMQAGTTAVSGAYYGAQYQRMKHAMNKWQVRGSGVFNDNAEWSRIQNSLDNADNQHIADAVNSILDNGKYTESQKRAIAGYASALVKMRGYNSALMAIVTDPKEPKRDNKLAEEMIGYNANPQQRRELYLEAYGRRKALSQFMDEEQIGEIVADPEAYLASGKADAFTAEQKAQIDGFAHNQIALNSTRQRIADDTDLEVANFEATVDRMSNDGNIVFGTIRNTGDDSKEKPRKEVVVIKGKVVTNDDGSVNVEQSDESLVALVDGKEQMIAPKDLADVEITSAEEQKNLEREMVSNEYVLSQESGMNGMPINKVGNTFKYLDTDGVEHTATIVPTANGQQLPDGQLFVSIDGAEPVAMSQTSLQVGINDYDYAQLQEQKRNKGKQKPTADTTSTDQVATSTEGVEATTDNAAQPQPQYKQGDRVSVNYGGQQYDGTITGEYNDGEKLLVEFEGPDGTRTYPFNMEDVSPIEVVAIPEQTDAATDAQIEAVEPTEEPTTEPTVPAKAIDRIPKDESGQPLYEQSDVATAAEAVLDETEGDADMASTVVNSMIEDKKKALDKANKAKSKGGNTISEKIASEKERKAAIDKAQSELDFWKGVADELAKRNGTTAENAAPQADTAEEAPTADEAATDVAPTDEGTGVATTTAPTAEEEQLLQNTPEWTQDKPADARSRGFRRVSGQRVDRQPTNIASVQGKETNVRFSNSVTQKGRYVLIDASQLQPSHDGRGRNPLHFIDEAQPKERTDTASDAASEQMAKNIRPEEITSAVTAYTGAPTINSRGEVIQGNNRAIALKKMHTSYKGSADTYKQYLKEHAEEFGLTPEDIDNIPNPVLVNMVDVDDATAIKLGQYTATDTESGGTERLKPQNLIHKMGNDMRSFVNILLKSENADDTLNQLIDSNGLDVLKWLAQKKYITDTQYASAFNAKGELTAEAKNDLRNVLYKAIFQDAPTSIEAQFNKLPAAAQKAILSTAFRDYDSPESERMLSDIQDSIMAFGELMADKQFADAKKTEDVERAIELWKKQYQIDNVTGQSYLPLNKYSNFVLKLVSMYKSDKQTKIQAKFNQIYDLVQGIPTGGLFGQDTDNTPRTLAQAVKETLNIEYNGKEGSTVLGGSTTTGTEGRQGNERRNQPREREESGERATDSTTRVADNARQENAIGETTADNANVTENSDAVETMSTEANQGDKGKADVSGEQTADNKELTIEEINASDLDEYVKTGAIAYLQGNTSLANQLAYLTAKEYVRNQSQNSTADSESPDTTQLGSGTDETARKPSRRSGKQGVQLDNGTDGEVISEQRESGENSSDNVATSTGERGDNGVENSTPGGDVLPTGDTDSKRRGTRRGSGDNVPKRRGRENSGRVSDKNGERRGNPGDDNIAGALADIKDFFKDPTGTKGKMLSIDPASLLALFGVQFTIKVIPATARLGYGLLQNGIHKLKEWKAKMHEYLDEYLGTKLTEEQIDDYIEMMWDYSFKSDGKVHKLSEWASILSEEELRRLASMSIEEKRQLQKSREKVETKVCDLDNIRESLPFLLPEQQEDVLKAETQFFDESHNDEAHAYGKGYMFTNGTGTGKTYTGLGIVKRFLKQGKKRILIVTVSEQKIKDWIRDAQNLGIEATMLENTKDRGKGVVVTQPANLRQNYELLKDEFDLIVYDESHKLMENQQGEVTSVAEFHHMLANRDAESVIRRKMQHSELAIRMRKLAEEIKQLQALASIQYDKMTAEQRELDSKYSDKEQAIIDKSNEITNLKREFDVKVENELKSESAKAEAEESVKRTKVVFLSATPFNTPSNLDYVEGYIFTYPKLNDNSTRRERRDAFLMDRFGSGYVRGKNNKVAKIPEGQLADPLAVSREEIAFADYLQNELNTMSGRMISSEYDYSREFPRLKFEQADMFNAAIEDIVHGPFRPLRDAFSHLLNDYPQLTAYLETIKANLIADRIREHIALGRKVVVFHRRKASVHDLEPPFATGVKNAMENRDTRDIAMAFAMKYSDLLDWEKTLNYKFPHELLLDEFSSNEEKVAYRKAHNEWEAKCKEISDMTAKDGKERRFPPEPKLESKKIKLFNGDVTGSKRDAGIQAFNDDNSGCDIIVVQSESGREGISLHDKTGKYQRALISLQLPQSPIGFIQTEGRTYRIGNKSNAVFEYPMLGLDIELLSFAQKINGRSETTENLALGSSGRGLRESISRGALNSREINVSKNQGVGGKELDNREAQNDDGFADSLKHYAEWKDTEQYDDPYERPVPNPIGFLLNKWARIENGETVLVPNANTGTVARYVPQNARSVILEPVLSKFSRLMAMLGGGGRKLNNTTFQDYSIVNKADCIVINTGHHDSTMPMDPSNDIEDVSKALRHLEISGRLVALVRTSQVDKILNIVRGERTKEHHIVANIKLGDVAFNGVPMSAIIIDSVTENTANQYAETLDVDLSAEDTEEALYAKIRDLVIPERKIDEMARRHKKVAAYLNKVKQSGLLKKNRSRFSNSEYLLLDSPSRIALYFAKNKCGIPETIGSSRYYTYFEINLKRIADNELYAIEDAAKKWVLLDYYVNEPSENVRNYLMGMVGWKQENVQPMLDLYRILQKMIEAATDKTPMQLRNIAQGKVDNEVSGEMSLQQFREVFDSLNNNESWLNDLADKVFETAAKIPGLKFSVQPANKFGRNVVAHYAPGRNAIELNSAVYNSRRVSDSFKAQATVHETIHAITCYMLYRYRNGGYGMTEEQKSACEDILRIYDAIKDDREFTSYIRLHSNINDNGEYGLSSAEEMIAEMANPVFRTALKAKKLWRQLVNGIKVLLGINLGNVYGQSNVQAEETDAFTALDKALNTLMDTFDPELYKQYVPTTTTNDILYRTSSEIDAEYPNWLDGTTTDSGKHSTQVAGTVGTYKKVGEWIRKNLGDDVRVLDASSGMGLGTQTLREQGMDIEDVEPYQSEERKQTNPATYSSYGDINGKFDYIISNAVLNVIPDDWRSNVLHDMASRLKDGGRLFINTRKAGEEKTIKDKIELDSPQEVLVKRNGKIASYQRFFTPKELKEWVENELGDEYSVEVANESNSGTKGLAAVVVTKDTTLNTREGNGVATDNDVVMAVDPVSKVLGSPRGTAQQRKARAERERRRMAETVGQMVEKLQLDNVDVVTDTSTLSGRKAKAKGWYDPKTGRIVVVLPNHSSSMDVAQTVLHEAVAHYGLRRLFGDHFDSFLDTVWLSAEGDVKQRILNLAQRNGWNFRTATEEYLASLAEDTEFDNINASWWNKIKSLFSEMLDKLGLGELLPMKLSDNELRYILWRSYMNLQGKDVGIMGNAADISKQMQLGVGNFTNTANNDKAADAEPLFRDGTPVTEGAAAVRKALVRDKYEQRIKSGWYQTAEAIYDSMQSVKNAMEMVYEAEGEKKPYIEDIPMYENAYIGENVLSSMNKAQADYFANTLFKAMVEEYSKLARTKEERRDLDEYMMAKHGLERNEKMAERDAQKAYDEYKAANPSGTKTLSDFLTAYRQKEYAGLVGLFAKDEQIATALDRMEYLRERLNNVTDPSERAAIRKQIAELRLSNHIRAEKLATDAVELYESENETADLWEAVRGVTGYTLEKQLSTGLMAADTYNKIKAMYDYYIPLRGFEADVSEDVYAYLGDNGANRNETFVPVAEGRESKADNPLAYMQSMAESVIQSGNRNEMVKQRFLTFVQNHPSDLYSVSEMWLAYNEDTEEWEPVINEEIDANDSPATVAAKQQAFEEHMAKLAEAEPDKFRKASQAKDIPYRVLKKKQLKEHQVMVKRNGITYIITVNGNPRLAQAINGMTNPDADISGAVGKIVEFMQKGNRTLSQLYTSRNPNFVVSNFIRDSIYSSTMLLVKESPEYLANFIANVSKYNPWKMSSMFRKWNRGEVDDADMLLFKRFMLNGGETGYTELKAMEERKNDIAKQIKNATGKSRAKLIWEWIATSLDVVGRAVENTNRFGAFVTSLDMGRDVTRAAYDAKEISVNFNRKGSGSKMMGANGQTKFGNTAAFVSGVGRSLYIFWNAAIQGTGNLFKNYRRHPLKATAMTTFWLGLGYLMSAFMMGADGDGDDDDKEKYNGYFNLSQFIRRDNLCISVGGGQYATLPLPIEFRAVYGIGELFGSVTSGKEQLTGDEIAYALFEQVSQIAPIDYSSGGMNAFIPSVFRPLVEVAQNKSWTGLPIAKETPFNKYMPEYTKHYKNTNGILVGFTEQLNHAFGGDKVTRASTEWAEVNPAKVEYLMNAYLGGFFQVVDQTIKTAETVAGAREFDPRNITLLNRVLKSGDERTAYRKINNDFYKAKEKYRILKGRLNGYKREALLGDEEYRQKWVNLMSEKEFEEMKVFDVFNKQLNKLYEVRKQMPEGSDEAKEIDTMSQALRIDALQAISDISNE